MIAYFDSSSIVKWFFDESYSDLTRSLKDDTNISFTSILSYPEVLWALTAPGGKVVYDAVHLTSAFMLKEEGELKDLFFSCFVSIISNRTRDICKQCPIK